MPIVNLGLYVIGDCVDYFSSATVFKFIINQVIVGLDAICLRY